jgi:hypothetical protein
MKKLSIATLVGAALALCACANPGQERLAQTQEAGRQVNTAKAQCNAQHWPTVVEWARCYDAAENAHSAAIGPEFADITYRMQAERMAIALKVDQGLMTRDEANVELMRLSALAMQAAQQRINAAMAATAAIVGLTTPAPVYRPSQPTSCYYTNLPALNSGYMNCY